MKPIAWMSILMVSCFININISTFAKDSADMAQKNELLQTAAIVEENNLESVKPPVLSNNDGVIVKEHDPRENTPPMVVVADWEKNELKNNLGGICGTWDIDLSDASQFCTATVVPVSDIAHSNYVLKINYDMESDVPSSGGFWMLMEMQDFSTYDQFEFMVKGAALSGDDVQFKIEFSRFETLDKKNKLRTSYVVKNVTNYWQKVIIPLNKLNGFSRFDKKNEWQYLSEFSLNFYDRLGNALKGTIYIDDLVFTKTVSPGPHIYDKIPRRVPKTKEDFDAKEWAYFLIDRLHGFPTKVVLTDKEFPRDDYSFLLEIARDTFKYFENFVDKETGIPLNAVVVSDTPVTIDNPVIGDYTNITDIGVYFMSIVGACELKFITKEDALGRVGQTLHSLEKMEKYRDYFYNYYDSTNLERTSDFLSSVDSGWLVAGLYVIKNYFDDESLQHAVKELLDGYNFKIFYNEQQQHLSHGYYVNVGVDAAYDYGVFYAEPRVASYIAIARGDVPKEHWFKTLRTFPPNYSWQKQTPIDYKEHETLGFKYKFGYYQYGDLKYIPSWGGSLFEALMPSMILAEQKIGFKGLGRNNLNHILGQIKYAKEELKYPVWGMSPCSVPEGGYSEYGAAPFGAAGYASGVVTPHVTFLSLEYLPKESITNLRMLLALYPNIYGEYGFYDSVNVASGKVPYTYLALDQGMSFIGLVNYLTNGKIRDCFNKEPIFKKYQKLISAEKFFE